MEKMRKWVLMATIMTFTMTSLHAQECDQEDEEDGSAYVQSSYAAHWSVYIPITLLVVAAIWFGVADQNQHDLSSNSQDALGSIDNSKRQPSSNYSYRSGSSYRSRNYSKNYRPHHHHHQKSRGGYSH